MATTPEWERHPADLARLVVSLLMTAGLTLFAWLFDGPLTKASTDLVRLLANIPAGFTLAVVGLVQLVVVISVAAASIVLLLRRRWRLIGLLAISAGLAAAVMVALGELLDGSIPADLLGHRSVDSWLSGSAFPSASLLAAGAAVVTATAVFTTRSWHRFAWATVGAVAFLRVLTATEVPVNLLLILSVGASMGSAALVLTGAPHRRIGLDTVADALDRVGLAIDEIAQMGEQRTAPTFRVRLRDSLQHQDTHQNQITHQSQDTPQDHVSRQSHAVLLGRDQRDYDLLLRVWRSLRVKGFNERRPVTSPRRAAEHEQYVLAIADAAGVTATKPVSVALTDDGAAVVVTTWIDGESLGGTPVEGITDELLRELWRQVAMLHSRRIAHRWLNLDSVMAVDGQPVLVGFRWSATNADDALLGADVAELLSSLAARFGVERAVESARDGLGEAALRRAMPLLQPLVIASATRDDLKAAGISTIEIREGVQQAISSQAIGQEAADSDAIDTDEFELAPVSRVSLKGVVSLVGSIVLAFYVFSLASDWRNIFEALGQMNWAVLPLLVALVLVINSGGAMSLMGSVNIPLAFLRTNQIMFAQGFLNRFTPANAGGMALRARYLQREGVELNVGAAAVGLASAASGVVQLVFIGVFLIWGGATNELSRFGMPSATKTLAVIVAVGVVVGAIALSGWGRRAVVPKAKQLLGPALTNLAELARQPTKLALLFGGTVIAKLAMIIAFAACASAFGVDLSFARIGALFMIANTIGSAVPTPGGVGGLEAALTAALISGGVDAATAGAVVLVFRLLTFWLPTIPGWVCLQRAQRTGLV
ncbi:MAG: lysylphosphatidylglycerol synthase domain-containing protein [Microthrixaceae bacterium]